MKKLLIFLLNLLIVQYVFAQQKFKGYPDKDKSIDLLQGFIKPPKGYGNVPFYWWNGDSLDVQRMSDQLDILASSATDGFAVSYIHLDPNVDVEEMKGGYGLFGKTEPGRPKVFSDEWWKIWKTMTEKCAEKGLGLGMDDYTIGWEGNGYYPDEIMKLSGFKNYKGKLEIKRVDLKAGKSFDETMPDSLLTVSAWPLGKELTEYIKDNKLVWHAPNEDQVIYIIKTSPSHLLHPDFGKKLIEFYFDKYEKHVGEAAVRGMNYFFQDELYYPIGFDTWAEDFREEFKKRKGYDIILYLPAIKYNIGKITPKIRLDYAEVITELAEERYFKPIFDWHASRGLIYGADNLGRGLDPLAYMDYFRANSWFTAPGNDAPSTGSSFMQTKVSSSITHMYDRPRTWLEAFHSMGWGSSGSWLTRQIDHHFMAGGNLVCMHGLYYSTHGGWWEWAPPCFHFRMPYWPHVKKWLEYTERVSYLMSQGKHVCDIALLYPTEPMTGYPDMNQNNIFQLASNLSNAGLDYDFTDYQSLRKAVCNKGEIKMASESFKIIVMADMKAMQHTSLTKILEHYRSGGIVLACGELPAATTLSGEGDKVIGDILKELFGMTREEALEGRVAGKHTNKAGGIGWYMPESEIVEQIRNLITSDFIPAGNTGKVLHRRVGDRDIYMVTDVPAGSKCFFRATGKVEVWNAKNGEISTYPVVSQNAKGTELITMHGETESCIYVFSSGKPEIENSNEDQKKVYRSIALRGDWEVELLPTMDNKYGDFRFPASGIISAEARAFKHMPALVSDNNWILPDYDDAAWIESIYGYGPQAFENNFNDQSFESSVAQVKGKNSGEILEFSWQYGVWDNPGSQGYHGLKAKVSNGFFILDKGGHQFYTTWVYAPTKGKYRIEIDGVTPTYLTIDDKPVKSNVILNKGWHRLNVGYADTKKTPYKMQKGEYIDNRDRSAVVLFHETEPELKNPQSYDKTISMKWGMGAPLKYDPFKGENKVWNYRFKSVPGMKEMEFTVTGKELKIWYNGIPVKNIIELNKDKSGKTIYKVTFDSICKLVGTVAFSIERETGVQGAAVICEPIKIKTAKGLLSAGNWAETGALRFYSGGMYYRKDIDLFDIKQNTETYIDLGDVIASCELRVNGSEPIVLMSPPYKADISKYLINGKNNIEILVYSTLSNHYQTIPTPYRDNGKAGLIGPVRITMLD